MPDARQPDTTLRAALLTSAAMIAYQVAGKATRDGFFLSTFPVTALPTIVAAAAVLSIVVALGASRWMTAWGPRRVLRAAFAGSAVLLLGEWLVAARWPRPAAAAVYLHFSALGALLISGFWSLISERFDPRTAKRHVGRIGAAGTLGGLVGGIIAERVGATFGAVAMLPILGGIHLLCAAVVQGVGPAEARASRPTAPGEPAPSALRVLGRTPYLRSIVVLVVLAAITEGVIDYVFKARATGASGGGRELIRFFAVFYAVVAVLTFAIQSGLSRRVLETLGLARTVAALPTALGATASAALLAPGLATAALARGTEAVLRNSLFRSGYEVLFTPVPRDERRGAKPIIDVGFARVGDMLGAGLVQAVLWLVPIQAVSLLTGLTVAGAGVCVWAALRLHRGYLQALERSLLNRAVQLDLVDVVDSTTRSVLLTALGAAAPPQASEHSGPTPSAAAAPPPDPQTQRRLALQSGDPAQVRPALSGALPRPLVGDVIPLLAWDEVAPDAARALRALSGHVAGQLVDALVDPEEEFAVRRRIPGILATSTSPVAAHGLWLGLRDPRFEVRYRCGLALARVPERAREAGVDADAIFGAVERELNVGRGVWESQRVLDRLADDEASPFVDEYLRDRASRSLEHVFTLLSLVLPRQPLRIAFQGLHTDDQLLRGTALEYLESVLPPLIRDKLWPLVEDRTGTRRPPRPRAEIVADLMRSHESIAMNLNALRKRPPT